MAFRGAWYYAGARCENSASADRTMAVSPHHLGGIWGLLFLLPLMKKRFLSKGLIYSLGPTLVQFFIVFPMQANKGVMGLDLPVFRIFSQKNGSGRFYLARKEFIVRWRFIWASKLRYRPRAW